MKKLALVVAIPGLFVLVGYSLYRYYYPYDYKHCCLKILGGSLIAYAERHNGRFPEGAGCPEASLSLLSREDCGVGAETLCGKTVSEEITKQVIDRGELLGPSSCDWHYVEGLTLADDPRIAIVWDKVGLGHDGQRLEQGGHSVFRLGYHEEIVAEAEWPQFLKEQEQLLAVRSDLAKRGIPALTARIRLPTGQIVDHFDGSFTLSERFSNGFFSSGTGQSSGDRFDTSSMRWWRLIDGTTEYTLTLNDWTSVPVVVKVAGGKASPDAIVFEMHPRDKPPRGSSAWMLNVLRSMVR